MYDPLSQAVVEGDWRTIGLGHELIHLGGDRILDWEGSSGAFRVWHYDRFAGASGDPLPHAVVEGQWDTIRTGHRILHLGGDHLLFWNAPRGEFRVFAYDRNATGSEDPIPGDPTAEGRWGTIGHGHSLLSLDHDRLLDWVPDTGDFRIWQVDRRAGVDPLPRAIADGNWRSIRTGHELHYLGGDQILDWEPQTGAYRVWYYDRSAEGKGADPLPSEVTSGQWGSIRTGHELVTLDDRLLDWEPRSGSFRIWQIVR